MNKIFLYAHGGSGNHGCEAIVRSTLKILKNIPNEKLLISTKPEEDAAYGIDDLCKVLKEKSRYRKFSKEFINAYVLLKMKQDYIEMDKLEYLETVKRVNKGDIALSIGGDNYCYADVKRYIMLHDMFLKQGAKTVLWGCSVEPDLLHNPEITEDMKRYSLITARESISYQALKQVNPNTILVADPAFVLERKEIKLPEVLKDKQYIGINISPMIVENEMKQGITLANYQKLIDYILDNTDFNIALIPHVIWDFSDDRIILKQLYNRFKESNRICLIEDCTCQHLKYIISKSNYFIGARTHSTIAAYSSGVPTLVVGYSVKAIGIAKDLFGTSEKYVIPVQKLYHEDELLKSFLWLQENAEALRYNLQTQMKEYCSKSYLAYDALNDLVY